jgi:hypothetical protein
MSLTIRHITSFTFNHSYSLNVGNPCIIPSIDEYLNVIRFLFIPFKNLVYYCDM